MDYKEEQKEYFKIRQKHSAKIPSFSSNLKVIQDSEEDCGFKRKFTSKVGNSINVFNNKKEKFYKKFVNRLKKRKENFDNSEIIEEDEEEGKDKFLNLVNKVMNNQILITNDNIRLTIDKPKKKISKGLKRLTTFNIGIEDDYINNIKLIQRKFKDYKNKEITYNELVNKEKEYLTVKQIKNKTKEDLEIELIKSIGKIKELFEIIKFYKNKVNVIQFEIAYLKSKYSKMNKKSIFQIEKQQNIYLIKNNNNSNNSINDDKINNKNNNLNIKEININNDINSNINEENSSNKINSDINDTIKTRISNIKNTKNILKTSNNLNKATPNKRDTIIGLNYQNYTLNIGKNKEEEKQNKENINVNNENDNINIININITNNNNETTYLNNNKEKNETINNNNDKINNDAINNENNVILNNINGTVNLNINKENNNPINNNDDTTTVDIEVEDNSEEKKKRLKKSRGLRKLLAKKAQEKKDNLRKYFIKFYLAGLYMAIRKGVRRKTCDIKKKSNNRSRSAEQRRGTTINIMQDVNLFNFSVREEEMDNINAKKKELLTKIIYRKDRIKNLIMKTTFEKFNLRAKLLSLKADKMERMNSSKYKNKVKKKGKKSSKSVPQSNNKIEQNKE